MKTIIARFQELKKPMEEIGEIDGEIVDANKIETALRSAGVALRDFQGQFRDFDDVILELSSKWDNLDLMTQRYIATVAAGARQQSRFIALVSDNARLTEMIGYASNAAGSSNIQFEKTLDSLESKMNALQNAVGVFFTNIANSDVIKSAIDLFTLLLNTINTVTTGFGNLGSGVASVVLAFFAFRGLSVVVKKAFGSLGTLLYESGYDGGAKLVTGVDDGIKGNERKIAKSAQALALATGKTLNKSLQQYAKGNSGITELLVDPNAAQFIEKNTAQLAKNYSDNLRGQLQKHGAKLGADTQQIFDSLTVFDESILNGESLGNAFQKLQSDVKGFTGELDVNNVRLFNDGMARMQNTLNGVSTVAMSASAALMLIANSLEENENEDAAKAIRITAQALGALGLVATLTSQVMALLPASSKASAIGMKLLGVSSGTAAVGMWSLLAPLLLITAAIGVLIGVIMLMVHAFNEMEKNSLEGQMKEAEAATKRAQEAAEKAQQAYDELLGDSSKYDELQNTLDELTEGTNEWKEALIAANQQVLDLITTYPMLARYMTQEGSQLKISNEGWDELIKTQQDALNRARSAILASQMGESRLRQDMATRELQQTYASRDAYLVQGQPEGMGSYWTNVDENDVYSQDSRGREFLYEQNTMNAMLKAFNNNAAELFTVGPAGEYSAALEAIAEQSNYTAEELWETSAALAAYSETLATNNLQLQKQAEAILLTQASERTTDYDYGNNIITAFARTMTGSAYEERERTRAGEIYQQDGFTDYTGPNSVLGELAEKLGVTAEMVNDMNLWNDNDLTNLQTIYAAMAGIAREDIGEGLAKDKQKLAAEIAKMDTASDMADSVEEFRIRMENISERQQRELASLMSSDASLLNLDELRKIPDLLQYAIALGYRTVDEMARGMGIEDSIMSELSLQEQNVYAKLQLDEGASQEEIDNFIADNQDLVITAEGLLRINQIQVNQQMEDQFNEAAKYLRSKGVGDSLFQDLPIEIIKNLSGQVSKLGAEAARDYVKNFDRIIYASNLGASVSRQMETYLSTVDWSNMTQSVEAIDYLRSIGVGSNDIATFWNSATSGADAHVSSLTEMLGLMGRMQQKSLDNSGIANRLSEGTATYDDMIALTEAGADIGDFQFAAEGWRATADSIALASQKLKEFNTLESEGIANRQREAYANALELSNSTTGVGANGPLTTQDDQGKYVAGNFLKASTAIKQSVADQLGVAPQGENESLEAYWRRVQEEYIKYINLLNNGAELQALADKMEAYAKAAEMTSSDNEALGGSDESVIYSAQNEAVQAGLDPKELMEYADVLQSVRSELDDVTAVQIALLNSKMNAGLGEIMGSYSDWTSIIDETTGALKDLSAEGAATYNKLRASVNKMLNTSEDLSDAFWDNAENMKNIKAAAEGSEEALAALQVAATQDYLVNLALQEPPIDELARNAILTLSDFIANYDLPKLNINEVLDDQEFINRCNDLIKASGMTAQQVANSFKSMGYDVKFSDNMQPVMQQHATPITTYEFGYNDQGQITSITPNVIIDYTEYESLVAAPTIETLTSAGSQGGGVSVKNKSTGAANKKKSSGGGKKAKEEKKTDPWEQDYDWLYNLLEKTNEALRKRNRLEQEYDRMLRRRNTSAIALYRNLQDQLANLKEQQEYYDQQMSGRMQEQANIEGEYSDLRGYAHYNEELGYVEINWDAINRLSGTDGNNEIGDRLDEYIQKLEEVAGKIDDVDDSLYEIIGQIEEIYEIGKEEYLTLEDRIHGAIIATEQEKIDALTNINDSINNANSKMLDKLQRSIDESRRIRENQEREEEITKMERRLAYLQQDTSGGNQLEILRLQEDIEKARQDYTDGLIDQKINELQVQNDLAAEQRELQIQIAQAQLDYAVEQGQYWAQTHALMSEGISAMGQLIQGSQLAALLKSQEGFQGLSELGRMQWLEELEDLVAQSIGYLSNNRQVEQVGSLKAGDEIHFQTSDGWWVNGIVDADGSVTWGDGRVFKDIYQMPDGTYRTTEDHYGSQPSSSSSSSSSQSSFPETSLPGGAAYNPYGKASETSGNIKNGASGDAVKAIQWALQELGYSLSKYGVDGKFGAETEAAVRQFQRDTGISVDGIVGTNTRSQFALKGYKTGGLADKTGLAWLDGTKAHPELVLNAKDTQNFIALKDVLSNLKMSDRSNSSFGDNYFDIRIAVDELANDYDVDQLAARIKGQILEDSQYRNVNAVRISR